MNELFAALWGGFYHNYSCLLHAGKIMLVKYINR